MYTTENKNLCAALVKVMPKIKNAAKNKKNPHLKNEYADLESVLDAVRPYLSEFGLYMNHSIGLVEENKVSITMTVGHESGEMVSFTGQFPMAKVDAQGAGGAITYLKRYMTMSFFGIVGGDEDDDGNAASNVGTPERKSAVVSKPVPISKDTIEKINKAYEKLGDPQDETGLSKLTQVEGDKLYNSLKEQYAAKKAAYC